MFSSVNNESVVQQIINKITDAIISGELKPGDKLPTEMEMIDLFKVSRNSLRSAIQTLRSYGVLEVRRPEGTFVCTNYNPQLLNPMLYSIILHDEDTHASVVGLRQIIDMGVSKLVVSQGLTEEETALLEQRYAELVEEIRRETYDIDAVAEADRRFHEAVAEVCHNPLAVMLNDFLLNVTSESRVRTIRKIYEENDSEYLVKVHRMHLDALEKKPDSDLDAALSFSYYYWKHSYNW